MELICGKVYCEAEKDERMKSRTYNIRERKRPLKKKKNMKLLILSARTFYVRVDEYTE